MNNAESSNVSIVFRDDIGAMECIMAVTRKDLTIAEERKEDVVREFVRVVNVRSSYMCICRYYTIPNSTRRHYKL